MELPGLVLRPQQAPEWRGLAFVGAPAPRLGPHLSGKRESFDLARLARLVARRHLPGVHRMGRSLGCIPGPALTGWWDRRWSERMIGGMLSLALQLIPDAPVTLEFDRQRGQAVVQASCEPCESPPRRRPDLARMTRAREEWELSYWLWRAVARSRGGSLTLVHDRLGPCAIRFVLPR
jgi:hypothetical protein